MTKEDKIKEAVCRMKILNLHENAIKEFSENGLVNVSEYNGSLFWTTDAQKQCIEDFEKEYDAVVYHVIHNKMEFGECLSLLYVSNYKEEWAEDKKDLEYGTPFVYVKNLDDDICSEFGRIGIDQRYGGLIRIS